MSALTTITTKLNNMGGRQLLKVKKHSPELLIAAGIIGGVGAGVIAVRATHLHLNDILYNHALKMESLRSDRQDFSEIDYPTKDHQKNQFVVYTQTAVQLGRVYGPAITLAAASTACILGGSNILKKRNVALAAAYKLVEQGFTDYRGRVIDELGEEADQKFRYDISEEKTKKKVKGEDGKEKTVTDTVKKIGLEGASIYARNFSESWDASDDPEYNEMYIRQTQSYFQTQLHARGHVFLNEVYDKLGFPRTKEGAVVGWIRNDATEPEKVIIFSVDGKGDVVCPEYGPCWLDFNVDGPIFDLI